MGSIVLLVVGAFMWVRFTSHDDMEASNKPLLILTGQSSADSNFINDRIREHVTGEDANIQSIFMLDSKLRHADKNETLNTALATTNPANIWVLLAFDAAGERLPILGDYGKLQKLLTLLTSKGIVQQNIAFMGTGYNNTFGNAFDENGKTTDNFVKEGLKGKQTTSQVDELAPYLNKQFMVWSNQNQQQNANKLNTWLAPYVNSMHRWQSEDDFTTLIKRPVVTGGGKAQLRAVRDTIRQYEAATGERQLAARRAYNDAKQRLARQST